MSSASTLVYAQAIKVEETNVSGGGFQSDVTISKDGLTVYSSADISGVFKSTDGGRRFSNRNQGLYSSKIASLVITPDNAQILYAGTGDKGGSGGLFRSNNGGDTWVLTADGDKAQFAGNHSASSDPIPKGHPRSNGDLIVIDTGENTSTHTDDIVITGTYKQGVRFFIQGGDKEVSAVNPSGFVRSVARHDALPNVVFAAIQFADPSKNGVYRIDYTNISTPTSVLVYATTRPEGLAVLSNGHVYGALGTNGIVKYDGNVWQLVNSGLSVNNALRQWTAVAGYVIGDQDVVYAGTNNLGGRSKGKNYSNIWRTENGGNSWSPLVDAKHNVSDKVFGQSYEWWFRTDAFTQAGLGRSNSVVSSIAVSRGKLDESVADDIIFVSGRGGIWKSESGGDLWEPAVNNMQATSNTGVAVNPNNAKQIVLSNTDYVVLQSSDRFENNSMSRDKPKGAESRGYNVIFDVKADEVILGAGDRDTNNPGGGEVYKKPATQLGGQPKGKWQNTQLSAATSANNGRVRAVSYGYHDGQTSTSQTILAAVEGEGVYRYHNGVWSKSRGVKIGSTNRSNFAWPNNQKSGVVYLLDLSSGLFRSKDGGQSWMNIWPTMRFRNNNFYNTGYIAADDKNPTNLYLSILGTGDSVIGARFKVFRLTNADTAIYDKARGPNITDISKHTGSKSIKRPGPLVIGPDGSLWLTEQQDSKKGINAALYYMQNPTQDTSFKDLTTNDYRHRVASPSGIDVSSDGYVYISQSGNGVIKLSLP